MIVRKREWKVVKFGLIGGPLVALMAGFAVGLWGVSIESETLAFVVAPVVMGLIILVFLRMAIVGFQGIVLDTESGVITFPKPLYLARVSKRVNQIRSTSGNSHQLVVVFDDSSYSLHFHGDRVKHRQVSTYLAELAGLV